MQKNSYHSWNEKRDVLYYTNNNEPMQICRYNLKNRKVDVITEGSDPIVSFDGNYIAFKEPGIGESLGILTYLNLTTNEEHKLDNVYEYRVSPDGKHIIAFVQPNLIEYVYELLKSKKMYEYEIVVWEPTTGNVKHIDYAIGGLMQLGAWIN